MHKEENTVVESMKRGFTLVEILVVIAIIGMLATIVTKNIIGGLETSRIEGAKTGCKQLKDACSQYSAMKHKNPTSLEQLLEGDEPFFDSDQPLYDPWDNKYEIEMKGKKLVIKSAGPDGQMGTEDDIRTDDNFKKKD